MRGNSVSAEREAMDLARKAVELDEPDRLAWVLRCHSRFDMVERVLRLVLTFDDGADQLGVALAPPPARTKTHMPLPAKVGAFRIVDLLGAGAFSRVYRAIDERSGDSVALKVLHVRSDSGEAKTRFEREIEVLSSLRHASIARFVDAGETQEGGGTTRWIAIELVEGESLLNAAKEQDVRWQASTIAQVARAIQYAHDAGVVHRDLKPSNVMITADGGVKVLDFGVAAIRNRGGRQRLTATGQVLGTIAYMAPEQVAGHRASAASDQFSLAAMLFEAATGKLPHSDGTDGLLGLFSIAAWDGVIDPALMKQLPPDLATILARSLEVDPALRYASASALADELERWLAGKRIQTTRPNWFRRAARFVRRNRKPVAAAAAAILVLSSALAVTLLALAKAQRESARAQSFGYQSLLPLLLHEVDDLWPQTPETVPRMTRWLEQAAAVRSHAESGKHQIEGNADLASYQVQLADLPGTMAEIRERVERASTLEERTLEAYADEWFAASERVFADPRFRGLELAPQVGLIPLGPDPRSGLEEFAVADWGSIPERDGSTKELVLQDDFAPVLVLLPGGPSKFGTAPIDKEEWYLPGDYKLHFVPEAEFGVREVDLDPFFIGKFEVTQAQWKNVTGRTPSEWGMGGHNFGSLTTGRHPVETIGFAETLEAARIIGCTLPTEAQWEFAAAPIERGLFWWSENSIEGSPRENLTPTSGKSGSRLPWESDPAPGPAAVGSFPANPNGLHDMMGNVAERCLDEFKVAALSDVRIPLAPGTGEVLADGGGDRSFRGGNFHFGFFNSTIPRRYGPPSYTRVGHLGARFARTLVR